MLKSLFIAASVLFTSQSALSEDCSESYIERYTEDTGNLAIQHSEGESVDMDYVEFLIGDLTYINNKLEGKDECLLQYYESRILLNTLEVILEEGQDIIEEPVSIYEPVVSFEANDEGVIFVVMSGGCTDKSKYDLVITEDQKLGLIRNNPLRCEVFPHPVEIKYSWEEVGVEPMSITEVAQ